MRNLLLKNLLIQKKTLLFTVVYAVAVFYLFRGPVFEESIYIMGATAIAYMLLVGVSGCDEKNNTEIVFASLPVRREVIVLSNYLSVLMFMVIGLALTGFAGVVLKSTGALRDYVRYINEIDVAVTFLNMAVMSSLYYPFYLKFGYQFVRIANMVLFLVMFFVPSFFISYIKTHPKPQNFDRIVELLLSSSLWIVVSVGLVITLVLTLISLGISIKIYKNREF